MRAHFTDTWEGKPHSRDGSMPHAVNNAETNTRLNSPSPGSNPKYISPARCRTQEVISTSHSSITKRDRNADPLDAPVDVSFSINGYSMSFFSKVIGLETVPGEVADVNLRERMKFASNSVLGETPKFVGLGLLPANTADKLNSVLAPATRAR